MIDFKNKGAFAGLFAAIAAAGHACIIRDGLPISSDDTAVQAIIDGYTLDDARSEVTERIDAMAKAKRDAVVASISPAEMASWSIKRAEAAAYDGTDASAPFLAAEAAARGVTTAALVAKVTQKGAMLSGLEAAISGTSGRHGDAVKALDTFEAIAAYDYSTGWPV